jgi:hypothetical protein
MHLSVDIYPSSTWMLSMHLSVDIYHSSTWMLSMHLSVDIAERVGFLDKWLLQTWQVLNQGFLVVKFK